MKIIFVWNQLIVHQKTLTLEGLCMYILLRSLLWNVSYSGVSLKRFYYFFKYLWTPTWWWIFLRKWWHHNLSVRRYIKVEYYIAATFTHGVGMKEFKEAIYSRTTLLISRPGWKRCNYQIILWLRRDHSKSIWVHVGAIPVISIYK